MTVFGADYRKPEFEIETMPYSSHAVPRKSRLRRPPGSQAAGHQCVPLCIDIRRYKVTRTATRSRELLQGHTIIGAAGVNR